MAENKCEHLSWSLVSNLGKYAKKGNIPWNKGKGWKEAVCKHCQKKYQYRPESRKGIFCSKNCQGKYQVGNKHPRWVGGKVKKCEYCEREMLLFPSVFKGRKFCSKKCRNKSDKIKYAGSGNPNWHNGISRFPHPWDFNDTLKEQIRDRDKRKCQLCHIKERQSRVKLCVHHIDYNKNNLDPHNLISLCKSCHGRVNGKRQKWIKKFQRIIQK